MTRAALFAAVRAYAPGGRFSDKDVQEIDAIADRWGMPRTGKDDWLPHALKLIREFEGCKLTAYPDPGTGGKPWTIGWGATTDEGGRPIMPGTVWTQDRADARLAWHVAEFGAGVDKALSGAATTAKQKGAMVSLAYNIGLGNFGSSTLMRKHKAGDHEGAAAQFAVWNKAAGKVLSGLTRRRAAEALMYKGLSA